MKLTQIISAFNDKYCSYRFSQDLTCNDLNIFCNRIINTIQIMLNVYLVEHKVNVTIHMCINLKLKTNQNRSFSQTVKSVRNSIIKSFCFPNRIIEEGFEQLNAKLQNILINNECSLVNINHFDIHITAHSDIFQNSHAPKICKTIEI